MSQPRYISPNHYILPAQTLVPALFLHHQNLRKLMCPATASQRLRCGRYFKAVSEELRVLCWQPSQCRGGGGSPSRQSHTAGCKSPFPTRPAALTGSTVLTLPGKRIVILKMRPRVVQNNHLCVPLALLFAEHTQGMRGTDLHCMRGGGAAQHCFSHSNCGPESALQSGAELLPAPPRSFSAEL